MPWNSAKPDISLVIPVYRRSGSVAQNLATIETFITQAGNSFQLILVDDGSLPKISQELFEFASARAAVTYIKHDINMGKGRAVADGVAAAQAPIVIFTDIDISYELAIVEHMAQRFSADPRTHFIVGSRRHPDSDIKRNYNIPRRILSWIFNALSRLVVGLPFTDVQCGIKGFRTDAARLLFSDLTISRYAFDVELFLRAKKYGLRYEEIPVVYRHAHGRMVDMVPGSLSMMSDLWRLYVTYRRARL